MSIKSLVVGFVFAVLLVGGSIMRFRKLQISVFMLLLIVSFQNCEGPKESADNSTTSKKKGTSGTSASSSSSGNSGLSSGGASSATRAPGSSGGSISAGGASGSSPSGGASSPSSGGTCLSCTNGGSSSGSGGSNGGNIVGGGGNYALEISQQPKSVTLVEGAEFTVGVTVNGGRPPYSYKWYRDNSAIPPMYGETHYETYTNILDRIYKEGDYHVVVTDADGTSKTSSKASVRMVAKTCNAGAYWFPISTQSSYPDIYNWIGDLFLYGQTKYFASQYSPIVSQIQGRYSNTLSYLGFQYFNLGANVSNNQVFTISCGTDVPTVQSSVCSREAPNKCNYWEFYGENAENSRRYYEGAVTFKCRNGYLEFQANTCKLITPPPLPPDPGGA